MQLKKDIEYFSLLNRHQSFIYQVIEVYAKGDRFYIKELWQEISYALWREYCKYGKLRYRKLDSERMYVIRIAVNTAITYYRQYHSKLPTISLNAEALDVEMDNEVQLMHEDLYELIHTLSAQDQRMVFYYLEQYPYSRIAEFEGMTETAVGTRMSRIFKKMKLNSENKSKE